MFLIIYEHVKYRSNYFQKLYDVAKRNCSEALQLSRKMEENEAYEQSENCLKIIKETMKANK